MKVFNGVSVCFLSSFTESSFSLILGKVQKWTEWSISVKYRLYFLLCAFPLHVHTCISPLRSAWWMWSVMVQISMMPSHWEVGLIHSDRARVLKQGQDRISILWGRGNRTHPVRITHFIHWWRCGLMCCSNSACGHEILTWCTKRCECCPMGARRKWMKGF